MTARILVSSCLLGHPVRYDGQAKTLRADLLEGWHAAGLLISFCPEVAAGLPIPRLAAEIAPDGTGGDVLDGRVPVLDRAGADVTGAFLRAARLAVHAARDNGCGFALLTDGSPSCGTSFIHAGRHDGRTRPGQGVVAAALVRAGVRVYAPARIAELAVEIGRCTSKRPAQPSRRLTP